MFSPRRIKVEEAATLLFEAPPGPGVYGVSIRNLSTTEAVELGDGGVTIATGYPLPKESAEKLDVPGGDKVYGAAKGAEVAVLVTNAKELG